MAFTKDTPVKKVIKCPYIFAGQICPDGDQGPAEVNRPQHIQDAVYYVSVILFYYFMRYTVI